MQTHTPQLLPNPLTATNSRFRREAAPFYIDALKVIPMHPCIGARIEGLNLRQPLSASELNAIKTAMDRFAVCYFPHQLFDETLFPCAWHCRLPPSRDYGPARLIKFSRFFLSGYSFSPLKIMKIKIGTNNGINLICLSASESRISSSP
jgi:hypothetical protein